MYEIFEQLLEINGITIYKFCKDAHISESTIYTWKKKKSVARPELAEKVCEYFGVSTDFLMGKTKQIECLECGQTYDPFDELDCAIHDNMHGRILEAQRMYPMLLPYKEIATTASKNLVNIQTGAGDRNKCLHEYLLAEFSNYVYVNYQRGKTFDFNDFCKSKIVKLIEDNRLPLDYIDEVLSIYEIDKGYINQKDLLLARVSNNQQLMRIMAYAEKLNPNMLDSLEIQVKALAESNDNEG